MGGGLVYVFFSLWTFCSVNSAGCRSPFSFFWCSLYQGLFILMGLFWLSCLVGGVGGVLVTQLLFLYVSRLFSSSFAVTLLLFYSTGAAPCRGPRCLTPFEGRPF